MKKRLLARMHGILIVLLFLHSTLPAQKRSVTGRVTDAKDGSPLQGVTVQPKGSNSGGVVTGADGRFTLPVEANSKTLIFSSVGYGSIERPIGSGSLNVALTASTANLNEI
ncbi:MAG TPA: carboxypeptidase-like regulatory domain-containing protein, partial [Puia sp.]|nr:carboxypeptidase-like regulatory domain-containing protein [Puia sp.]